MLYTTLQYIALAVTVCSALTGIYFRRYLTLFSFFLLIQATIAGILDTTLHFIQLPNNIAYYNIYLAADFFLTITALIVLSGATAPGKKNIHLYTFIMIFSAVYIYEAMTVTPDTLFNKSFLVSCALIVTAYITSVLKMYSGPEAIVKYRATIWAMMGIIYYYGCCIPYMGVLNYLLLQNNPAAARLYFLVDILRIVKYGFLMISFFYTAKDHKSYA